MAAYLTGDIVILGCGWAGVSAANSLFEKYPNASILCIDKDTELGGLLKTVNLNGFIFDIGGSHIIFSRDKEVLQSMLSLLGENVAMHQRKSYVYLNSFYVPYPFENGLYVLPRELRAKMIISFIEAILNHRENTGWIPRNLREWIYGFFGKEIAEAYLIPYNEKIWKRDLSEIDVDWIYTPGRLPVPDWRNVVKSAVGIPTQGYLEQAKFYYPRKGGIQSLYNAALNKAQARGLKVIKGEEAKEIKKTNNKWIINNHIETRKIISTIPLNELITTLNPPEHIHKLARQLDYNKVAITGIALKKKPPNHHWIYIPDKTVPFHRYAWISNYSPSNTPTPNTSALITETTIPPSKPTSKQELQEQTIQALTHLEIIQNTNTILQAKTWIHKYGYPIHTKTTNKARQQILNYLEQQGITTIGRWGQWKYQNTDKIYKQTQTIT